MTDLILATVDWTALKEIVALLTPVLLAYIMWRQRQADAKLELARIEAKKAARRAKAISVKTDEQTAILKHTKQTVDKVEKQTNGMTETARESGRLQGIEEGKQQHAEQAIAVAREVAKEIVKEVVPTPVVVTNTDPISVTNTEAKEGT